MIHPQTTSMKHTYTVITTEKKMILRDDFSLKGQWSPFSVYHMATLFLYYKQLQ